MLKQGTADRLEELRVTLTGKALREVQEIAEREDKTVDEVLRSAIGLMLWTREVKENGGKIVMREGNKDKYELAL